MRWRGPLIAFDEHELELVAALVKATKRDRSFSERLVLGERRTMGFSIMAANAKIDAARREKKKPLVVRTPCVTPAELRSVASALGRSDLIV